MKNLIIGDIEIFHMDHPKELSIYKGMALASALKGGGWRIPTFKELTYIYDLHKLGILNLNGEIYWSMDVDTNKDLYRTLNFKTGIMKYKFKNLAFSIRPVRSI
jgi:hypothetical protein